jgi:hypothetical protein
MSRFFFLALPGCCALLAQGSNALVSEAKFPWTVVRDNLLKMAEKMPAENYSFKPVPGSRASDSAWPTSPARTSSFVRASWNNKPRLALLGQRLLNRN